MSHAPGFIAFCQRIAERFAAGVLARDNGQLGPRYFSKAAARRFRQGLRALEAFLRRVILLLALELEPGLRPDNRPVPRSAPQSPRSCPGATLKILAGGGGYAPAFHTELDAFSRSPNSAQIPARGLLDALARLQALVADPLARARRLAFHLARHRTGPLLAPGDPNAVRARHGNEFSARFVALAAAIATQSRARPPPLGPRLPMPPRKRERLGRTRVTSREPRPFGPISP